MEVSIDKKPKVKDPIISASARSEEESIHKFLSQ